MFGSREHRTLDAWGWIFAIFGAICVANALWMLAGPLHWYHELPAAVPDTGPFNPHFVRDIGGAFFAVGVALGLGGFDAALARAAARRSRRCSSAATVSSTSTTRCAARSATPTGGSTCPACTCPRW